MNHIDHDLLADAATRTVLRGRRVAITGGTSGLGLALVRELHAQGAQVAFVARDAARVRRTAAEFPGSHGIVGDIADKEAIHRIALQINAALGGLDVLVNNASSLGTVPLRPLADTDCEDLERALAANLLGPFRLTRALLGSLDGSVREQRAHGEAAGQGNRHAVVVNVSSDAAVTPYAGWGAYGTSKAALHHLSRIWQQELVVRDIDVLSFDPGDMDTPLHAAAVPDADPSTLRQPAAAARELVTAIADAIEGRTRASTGASHSRLEVGTTA
ncbi:MAG: SDR family oxidoreductase [Burkholderiaceae bacterium]